jgi:hypothetical protein
VARRPSGSRGARYMTACDSDVKAFEKRQYRTVQPDLGPAVFEVPNH